MLRLPPELPRTYTDYATAETRSTLGPQRYAGLGDLAGERNQGKSQSSHLTIDSAPAWPTRKPANHKIDIRLTKTGRILLEVGEKQLRATTMNRFMFDSAAWAKCRRRGGVIQPTLIGRMLTRHAAVALGDEHCPSQPLADTYSLPRLSYACKEF
ncbi:hypothetical protein CONLIGDRAFT_20688 [Coniochaeta ligniaria NRRL 30616]|uniref:Uncharacterized protein n=1 Tax=Coniochaeta ligniaria NRRL 30616 TaxID=1408157 RepID=A0A1J7JXE6_9PEZI|nr:hypothetical protein CONLIGDRAFT_20688 [Coniochaeta ligniaria NRRL 30616]